jgi:hypothetical protein
VLDYHGRVGDERPEVIGLQSGISLEVLEEGFLISIIIWIFCTSVESVGER